MPNETKEEYNLVIVIGKDNAGDEHFQNRYSDLIKDKKRQSFGDGTIEITHEGKRCLIIGNGNIEITPNFLSKRLEDVKATNAIFTSHGSAQRLDKGGYDEYSEQRSINQLCKITSKNIHVFGCNSGAAKLPKDTSSNEKRLICHSSQKYTTSTNINNHIIKSLTEFYLRDDEDALKSLWLEPETIYIKQNKEIDKLTAPKEVFSLEKVKKHLLNKLNRLNELFGTDITENISDEEVDQYMLNCLCHFSARGGDKNLDKIRLLLANNKIGLNQFNNGGFTPLYVAALRGHLEVVQELLNAKAEIGKANNGGLTPLYVAVLNGHLEVVRELLTAGADKDIVDKNGRTPLYIAAHKGHLEVVKELINAKADKDMVNKNGRTPLYTAAFNGHLKVVQELINKKAKIDKADSEGFTPLYVAAQNGHLEVVQALIKEGAHPRKLYGLLMGNWYSWQTGDEKIKKILDKSLKIHQFLDEHCETDIEKKNDFKEIYKELEKDPKFDRNRMNNAFQRLHPDYAPPRSRISRISEVVACYGGDSHDRDSEIGIY